MSLRRSFRKKCLVRNDVFAIDTQNFEKMRRATTALLALPHEAFGDGMYQNTVNNGTWIENKIKVKESAVAQKRRHNHVFLFSLTTIWPKTIYRVVPQFDERSVGANNADIYGLWQTYLYLLWFTNQLITGRTPPNVSTYRAISTRAVEVLVDGVPCVVKDPSDLRWGPRKTIAPAKP